MKIVKYLLGIIVVLIIGFLLIGVFKPDLSYDCEILVEKSMNESWNVIQDEEKMADWLPGFQKIEVISGTPGAVGSVSNVYFISDGQEVVMQETITELVPNESIAMTYTSDFMDMDYKLAMTSVDGNTKISSSSYVSGNGVVSRSIIAMAGSTFKSQEDSNLSNLKNTIEQNTKSYSSLLE